MIATDAITDKIDSLRRGFSARRTGRLQDLRDVRSLIEGGDVYTRVLNLTSGYSDVYERGRRDGANYAGRFPVRRAIEATDVRSFIDAAMNKGLSGAK